MALIGGGGLIAIIAIGAALGGGNDESTDNAPTTTAPAAAATEQSPSAGTGQPGQPAAAGGVAAGDADEVDDVAACSLIDSQTVSVDITNNSSDTSSYMVDVNYLDAAGTRIADETFFVNYVRTNEHVVEKSFAFSAEGAASCEIAEVDRVSATSPDDISEVSCAVEGVDALGNISTSLTATNGSSGLSDYLISASLMRDGVRIGTVSAVIENVPAGQSAPGDGLTTAEGPADGVVCEVVHVERTSSD